MSFSELKVRTRLALGFGILLAFLILIAALSINKLSSLNNSLTVTVDFNAQEANLISQAMGEAQKASASMRNLIVLSDLPRMEQQKQLFESSLLAYDKFAEQLEKLFQSDPNTSAEEKNYLVKVAQAKAAALPLIKKASGLGLANDPGAPDVLMNETGPALDNWVNMLIEFRDYEIKTSNATAAEAHAQYERNRSLIVLISLIGVLISIGAGFVITRSILKQLGGEPSYAMAVAEEIASGNLDRPIVVQDADRTSLMFSIKAMRDQLAQIVGRVRSGTDTIATASAQIAAGNLDLSSRTEEQASSLEETASSMEELTGTVKQNADNARQANQLAVSASEVAQKGGSVVAQVVETMASINESSKKIVDIIGVIDGIAFQTNILALNAAVEAARAGEQGRGFAVVATEVRNLAHRSAAAAKEIKVLIDDSVTKVAVGGKLVDDAGATMADIVQSITRVTDIMSEIASASTEQTMGIEQVNSAISQMDEVTQQNAALVEEASAAASAMQEQAAVLSDVVSVFKLAHGAGAINHAAPRQATPRQAAARPAVRSPASPPKALQASKPVARPAKATDKGNTDDWEEF
ncbi:methyl-accepting chemotaxis protein [Janthinobacterium psychrotolerans]|uniref:Methyl-accepting chemotaxis protein n=1 Tax=Janthinobacterium psychrotolerans TaxID=1747903 RepID=A0A1A7C779_9BURK|nr:methyl-accepting chemotaxis protein [Janthinobacterium psychrotolerans]OBV41572.1 methyl-accepting chemotaxis protein [Janthinobacterium psychrotolerans]